MYDQLHAVKLVRSLYNLEYMSEIIKMQALIACTRTIALCL